MATGYRLRVAAGEVTATLTGFVTRVDLADLPVAWWTDTSTDLGNVRFKQSGAVVPFDIVVYDRTAKTGVAYFKGTLTTADNDFTVETVDGAVALATSDPNGRDAVWADYEAVYDFNENVDRTGVHGAATLVGDAALESGKLDCNTTGYAYRTGLAKFTTWTMSATADRVDTSQRAVLSYSDNSTNNANRASLLFRNATAWAIWNSTDTFLTLANTFNNNTRLVHTQNGTTDRKLWTDGVLRGTDTGTAQRPAGTGDTLFIGVEDTSNTERWNSTINRVYLRGEVLSADWLAAEFTSWEATSTFYTISLAVPGDPVSLAAAAATDTLTFTWVAGSGTTDGFEVRIDGGTPVDVAAATSYQFTGLTAGATHTLEVRAYNTIGDSAWVSLSATTSDPWPSIVPYPCPCGDRWRVEACDLTTGIVKNVLLPVAMDWETILNDIGRGSLTLPTRTVNILDVWPHLTSVYITRVEDDPANPEVMWAGIVEQVEAKSTINGGTVMVGMLSIESYLQRRLIRDDLTYTNANQNYVAASLVNQAANQGIPLTSAYDTTVFLRDRSYPAVERLNIFDTIKTLTDAVDGPDWQLVHTKTGGAWSTVIRFSDSVERTLDTVLKSDREGADYGLRIDATGHTTRADAIGDAGLIATATDASNVYPLFDAAPSYPEVTDAGVLQEYADGYVGTWQEPSATPEFTIVGDTPAPRDLILGDTAEFHIDQAAVSFHGRARVVGIAWRLTAETAPTRILTLLPVVRASESVLNQTVTEQCRTCR